MKCNECKHCSTDDFSGYKVGYCCYKRDGLSTMRYIPKELNGNAPDWCPLNKNKSEDKPMDEYKIVTVKHPNCNTPYTFSVPYHLALKAGDYVLCDTKTHNYPQVAQCITPSFRVSEDILKGLLNIAPTKLRPIVAHLNVEWCREEKTEDEHE